MLITSKRLRITKVIARLINIVIKLLKKNPIVIPIAADNDLSYNYPSTCLMS